MSKAELYEMFDQIIEKENNKKDEGHPTKEAENLKGGDGFVCSLECKTCGGNN